MSYLVQQSTNPRYCPVFDWVGEPYYFRDMPHETPPGARIDVEGFPRTFKIKSSHKTLPDFFLLSGKYAISSKTKSLLDRLEPDVHQFIPVKLLKKSGEAFEGNFFVLHICFAVDAIAPEQSDVSVYTTPAGRKTLRLSKVRPNLAARKDRIEGRHFWIGDESFNNLFFSSDEFFEQVRKAKLAGFEFVPMTEI